MRRKPSILHVTPYYPPDRIGGVGEVARIIHEELVNRGFHSEVLSSGQTRVDPRIRRIGKNLAVFVAFSWIAFQHARKFDVVHAHHGEAFLLLGLLRLFGRRPALVLLLHVDVRKLSRSELPHVVDGRRFGLSPGREFVRRVSRAVRVLMDRAALRLADHVTVETECLVGELEDLVPARDVMVVPYGLGAVAYDSEQQPTRVELLYVGTPGIRKRTHLLPLVLSDVRQQIPDAVLRIVGFGEDSDRLLMAEARRLRLEDCIDFIGPTTSDSTQGYYRSADVLVLPSAYEGLPLVLLESMRAGLPAVATDVSGHPEAIDDGVNGYLVPIDDPSAMAKRCIELIQNDARRLRFGSTAAANVRTRFSAARQADAYASVYEHLATVQRWPRTAD